MTGTISSEAASSAPATTSSAPRSLPIASTATRIMRRELTEPLRRLCSERLYFTAAIGAAVRAEVVRPLGLMAVRALVHAGRRDLVLRAPLVAPGLGCFPLGDCHFGGLW